MSSDQYKIGTNVKIIGKDLQGVIAFYGTTSFAPDQWIGIKLSEPKGKNNGTVKGVEYFTCEENHGLFVKPSQILILDEHGKPVQHEFQSKLRKPSGVGTKPKPTAIRRKSSPTKKSSSLSASSSRMSLASSRQSLSASRQSLSGSRQSLTGSRQSLIGSTTSQKTSPVMEKSDTVDTTSQIPKRASFIETGFVETLKPQFTAGQVITTPTPIISMEEKINLVQLQQEIENRNQQIRDLGEKLDTLKIKRQEDREKLKEFDKLKIQHEHLIEFKFKIMEAQSSLQKELQRAKQEAKDAIEAKKQHAEEVADLAETFELATLDKEMAEEKAETLQLELDACREKLEEVTLDLEILKAEMQERSSSSNGGIQNDDKQEMSVYEMKQLQQQNTRLRETLVRLRDLSAHDKHEYQKLLKDIDQKKSEIVELGKTKEKLSVRVDDMEHQISDLQEQVDAALGAEEMVVILGEQKLTLEEKVSQLQEEVNELEALQDMNDQLVESNAELEADLREELDLAQAAIRQAMRDRDAAFETIVDRETTINKFRDLVQKLQEQSLDLQQRLEKETNKPISALPEILDFKKMFIESKAHTKAIDLELRLVEIQQYQSHIKYLMSFMPESFLNRGSDHDAVLVLLLIPRLYHKSDILLNQIKDKFPIVDKVDRISVLKGHTIEQYIFRCRISSNIFALQSVLHQYNFILNCCKTDKLLNIGSSCIEMGAQEKIIDNFVELLKRDQLDENVPLDTLEKCVNYFSNLFLLLLDNENKLNQTLLLKDYIKCINSACDVITNDALIIKNLLENPNSNDIGMLCQYIQANSEHLNQQIKLIKRRLPPDTNPSNIGFNKDLFDHLYQCYQQINKIIKTLQETVKISIQTLIINGESDKGLSTDKIKDIVMNASDRIYDQDDLGPVQNIKNSLTFILNEFNDITKFLQDHEHEITLINNKDEEKIEPPIYIRSQTVKKELEQTKTLTSKLENKESDIKELRKVLKEKQEQLSEMIIRKELAEKKFANVNKDYELTIEKLQRKLEEAHNNYKKKEKEFEETLDHLQTDIDSLENEKGEMKEKLKLFSLKAQIEGNKISTQLPQQSSLGPSLPAVVRDSPHLLQEINYLRKLLKNERNERIKYENEQMINELKNLIPLPKFNFKSDNDLELLLKKGRKLKMDILKTLAKPTFPSVYKSKPGNTQAAWQRHFAQEKCKIIYLQEQINQFQQIVSEEIIKRKVEGRIEADFAMFPTNEMSKALKETKPVNIGFIQIPNYLAGNDDKGKIINLNLDFENLQKIMQKLMI